MPRFPSAEWIDEFCGRLVEQPQAGEVAEALDGVYRFVIEPAGPLRETHRYDVRIRPGDDGRRPRVHRQDLDTQTPRLTLTADYERWRQLISGTLDIGMAVMLRRLRMSGDVGALMRNLSSARPLADALSAVESQWLDD